jgi:hypothetical protein
MWEEVFTLHKPLLPFLGMMDMREVTLPQNALCLVKKAVLVLAIRKKFGRCQLTFPCAFECLSAALECNSPLPLCCNSVRSMTPRSHHITLVGIKQYFRKLTLAFAH